MARYRDIDQAVEHLGAYASREEWSAHRRDFLRRMLGPVPEKFGLTLENLFEEVHRLGHVSSMIGFIDEATLSVEPEPGRPSILDDYLKRRGWQETPRGRAYLQGIRANPPSLYEVQSVAPGEWVEFRDRLRPAPTVRVTEHLASQMLKRWDCVVGRIVTVRDEHMLTGGTLTLTRAIADAIEARTAGAKGGPSEVTTPLLLQVWLEGLLNAARRPLPTLQNTDGEPMLFAHARFKIRSADVEEIERRLDALAGWTRDSPDELAWMRMPPGGAGPNTVLANARIERSQLVVETNSRGRLDRALAELQPALGALVGQALTSYEDPQVAMREHVESRGRGRKTRKAQDAPELDPAEMQAILHRVKEQHYRKTLEETVPALGNRTPRQCARSKAGRQKLVRWLKDIENGELRQAADQGIEPMDFGWMWEELGIERE